MKIRGEEAPFRFSLRQIVLIPSAHTLGLVEKRSRTCWRPNIYRLRIFGSAPKIWWQERDLEPVT